MLHYRKRKPKAIKYKKVKEFNKPENTYPILLTTQTTQNKKL